METTENQGAMPQNPMPDNRPPQRITPPTPPQKKSSNIGLKLLIIAGISVAMLIPRVIIGSLIDERQETAEEAKSGVVSSWGNSQTIGGPVLAIPLKAGMHDTTIKTIKAAQWTEEEGVEEVEDYEYVGDNSPAFIYIVPKNQSVSGKINTQKLHRGIFDVVVYDIEADINGSFAFPDDLKNIDFDKYDLANSKLMVKVSDAASLSEKLVLKLKRGEKELERNPNEYGVFLANYNATEFVTGAEENFSLHIAAKGSSSVDIIPTANATSVHLESDYGSPSFKGDYLPDTRNVATDGFSAEWKMISNYYKYVESPLESSYNKVSVELIVPTDQYTQNSRAVKYSFLIVVLTFITVFVVEIRKRTFIHWIQYFMIGFAIMLFYVLLLSLSEHLAFLWSYIIASVMTIGLITAYLAGILRVKKTAFIIGFLLVLLYAFIYVLLSLESFSLLVGSIGLFVILALLMYVSRDINNKTEQQ